MFLKKCCRNLARGLIRGLIGCAISPITTLISGYKMIMVICDPDVTPFDGARDWSNRQNLLVAKYRVPLLYFRFKNDNVGGMDSVDNGDNNASCWP